MGVMKTCPGCMGWGHHDFREEDADFARTLPPAVLERLAIERRYPLGIVKCQRCEGTGEVSDEEFNQVRVEAMKFVARIARTLDDEQRRQRL